MALEARSELTPRQREILAHVVREYVATGQPVGSRHLVEQAGLSVSPSTVRNELSDLEARGLLTHPHTSAGRVPTERGYRFYADELLARADARTGPFPLDLSALRREVDSRGGTSREPQSMSAAADIPGTRVRAKIMGGGTRNHSSTTEHKGPRTAPMESMARSRP